MKESLAAIVFCTLTFYTEMVCLHWFLTYKDCMTQPWWVEVERGRFTCHIKPNDRKIKEHYND